MGLCQSGYSREMELRGSVYIVKEFYFKELVHAIVEAWKSKIRRQRPAAGRRLRKQLWFVSTGSANKPGRVDATEAGVR